MKIEINIDNSNDAFKDISEFDRILSRIKGELDKIRIDIHLDAIQKGRYELKLNEEEKKIFMTK